MVPSLLAGRAVASLFSGPVEAAAPPSLEVDAALDSEVYGDSEPEDEADDALGLGGLLKADQGSHSVQAGEDEGGTPSCPRIEPHCIVHEIHYCLPHAQYGSQCWA